MVGTATSGAAHNVPCPATVNAGDVLIAILQYEGATVAPTDPGGIWVKLGASPYLGDTSQFRMWIYGAIAAGTEDGTNVNFGSPANTNNRYGTIYRFTGARSDTIANVVGGIGFGTAFLAQIDDVGVTTPEADCLAVNIVGVQDDNAVAAFTGMTGGTWAEAEAEKLDTALTPDQCMQIQTATMASAGTINGGTQTMAASDPWGVIGFYIRGPAASDISITHVVGTLTLTRDVPSVLAQVPPTIGSLSLTSSAPAAQASMAPTIGSLSLTASAHTILEQLAPTIGTLNLRADPHTLVTGIIVNAAIGSLALSSNAPAVKLDITPTAGLLSLTAGVSALRFDISVQATTGVLTLSGGTHTLIGPAAPETQLLAGVGVKGESWVPPQFIQVLFDKVKNTTQRITDVLKE
jgi:hypothetical protein